MTDNDPPVAPDHDMANVPPQVPPNSTKVSIVTRAIFGMIIFAIGLTVSVMALVGLFIERTVDERTAQIVALASGVCFCLCGLTTFRRGTLAAAIFGALGVILGLISTFMR